MHVSLPAPALHLVNHDKMALVPVYYARQHRFAAKLVKIQLHPHRPEAYCLGGIADAQKRHSLAGNVAQIAEILQRIVFAVVLCHYLQASRAAVHRVQLAV